MKKWFKCLILGFAALLVLLLAVVVIVLLMSSREPTWYTVAVTGPTSQQARHAEQNLIRMQNWASATTSGQLDAKPDEQKSYTIELTDVQINALLAKWSEAAGIGPQVDAQVKDIRVRLHDGKITVAGRLVGQDRVLSLVFEPQSAASGYTQIRLDSLRAGNVPLPLVTVQGQREALARHLNVDASRLGIDEHNYATRETAGVYYLALLADLLAGKSPDLYGLLPYQQLGAGMIVATRVRKLAIDEGKLALTVELLPPSQRKALVENLLELIRSKSPGEPASPPATP